MITEVCQMIRAVKAGDQNKAISYASLLAENLDKTGKSKEATRIRNAINGIVGNPVVMDSVDSISNDFPGIYPEGPRVRF